MEVSILRPEAGVGDGAGLLPIRICVLLVLWLIAECLLAAGAYAFALRQDGGGARERLRADDLVAPGGTLGGRNEQAFSQGTLQTSLNDLSQPVDLNLSAAMSGSVTARVERRRAFQVRLSNAERARCLGDGDFDVSIRATTPIPDGFAALDAGGGALRVIGFEARYQGRRGRCERRLRYGFLLDLNLDGALSAGRYEATLEVTVTERGPGGATETLQLPLQIDMPGVLLLYHYSQINVDLEVSAIAGALGANSACSGGHCMDVGARTMPVSSLGAPIAMDVGARAGSFLPVQTLTLRNAIGARAIGCVGNVYDTASYQILSASGGIQIGGGTITGIQSQSCGLAMRTGDVSFDLDLTQADATTATATIQITVTGL